MFSAYYPTGVPVEKNLISYQILSIDPGLVNLGFRLERRTIILLKESPPLYKVVISPMIFDRINVKCNNFTDTLVVANNYFNSIWNILSNTDIIIIEHQISKLNPKSTRIFQHILTYFLTSMAQANKNSVIYEIENQIVRSFFGIPR